MTSDVDMIVSSILNFPSMCVAGAKMRKTLFAKLINCHLFALFTYQCDEMSVTGGVRSGEEESGWWKYHFSFSSCLTHSWECERRKYTVKVWSKL